MTSEPNYAALLNWVNITFPLGLTREKAQFETRSVEENAQFLIEKIKDARTSGNRVTKNRPRSRAWSVTSF